VQQIIDDGVERVLSLLGIGRAQPQAWAGL
jgi:hypothetical protein